MRSDDDYGNQAEQQPGRGIAPAISGQAKQQADKVGDGDGERPREHARIRRAGRAMHRHAAARSGRPARISSTRRSVWPGTRRNHSSTPVHSTQMVAKVSTAQMIFSGSPP